MIYLYRQLLYSTLSTALLLFCNIPLVDAAIIIRPPNNLGLVGYWSFEEGRGVRASDFSGNGNNGVLVNSPEWVNGRFGGGLDFSATSNQHNDIAPTSQLKPTGEITVSAWFYRKSAAAGWNPVVHGAGNLNGGTGYYFGFYSESSSFTWRVGDGVSYAVASNTLETGRWYHAVGVFSVSGGFNRLYINGEEVSSVSHSKTSVNYTSDPVTIGRLAYCCTTGHHFDGTVDEVRIYNRALSASEIQSLYSDTRSTVVGETSANYYSDGLVAHYTFDGSALSGTTVIDVVGDSDGTVSTGPVPTLGRIGQGMLFNGTTGGISLGSPSALQITGDQTIAMWVYPTTFGARRNPYAKAYAGEGTITQETNGTLNYYYGTHGGNGSPYQGFNSSAAVTLNAWNHIALVRDLSSNPMRLRWYINGTERSAANANYAAAVAGTLPALIGQGYVSRYAGVIDDVRIYNRALSADEVRGLAGGGIGVITD